MKKRKDGFFKYYLVSIISVGVIAASVTFILMQGKLKEATKDTVEVTSGIAKVQSLYDEILSNYVGDVDKEALINGALKGMTEALGDPHTSYLNQEESQSLDESISSSFEGIGATITLTNGQPTIAEAPKEGTPADKAGIKEGDIILKVDETSVEGLSLTDVVSKVRGKKGTTVKLEIQRDGETMTIDVERGTIAVDTVSGEIAPEDEKVGVINISKFSTTTFDEMEKIVKKLRKEGAEAFIIDVRGNPGGVLDVCEKISSMFLKNGKVIVQFEDKNGNKTETKASKSLDGGFKVTEPTVVLVDGNSASASEIFAAALKESAGVKVIGTTTYGKGTAQAVGKFTDGSEAKISDRKWLTPDGDWLNKKGLTPSIEVGYPDYAYLSTIDTTTTYQVGATGNAVKNIQEMLKALDYYQGEISGNYDDAVATAVKSFQTTMGLNSDGIINTETANLLMLQLAKKIQDNDLPYLEGLKVLK